MEQDVNELYAFDSFYTRETDLTYSNQFKKKDKWGNIIGSVFFFGVAVALIGVAVHVYLVESLVWPVILIGLFTILPIAIGLVFARHTRKILDYDVSIELNQQGFSQIIKNRKTQEVQELHLPFETMESVTMGRFIVVLTGRKYGPGTYWICIELAMKGRAQDGKMVLKRFPLKNPDEIQLWIKQFQQNNIPIYFTNTLIKDLPLEEYDNIKKVKYPNESGEIPLAYKTEGVEAPVSWEGKRVYY